jgi:hypothetical protein
MTKEEKNTIIERCIEHIDNHGSVRIGWAVEQIVMEKQQNHVLDKIANTIIQTGEYVKEPSRRFKFDWNIYRNPNYKKTNWTEKHPILKDFVVGTISAIFSLVVGLVLWSIQDKSEAERRERIEKKIEQTNKRIDSLYNLKDTTKLN